MKKKTNPKFIVITVISLVFMFVLMGAAYFMTHFLRGDFSESSNEIGTYGAWSLPEKYSRLLVFPEEVPSSAENVKYYYQYDSGWDRPMCQIYLSCTLSDEEYAQEKERLAGLSWTSGAGTIAIRQDEESFSYPAYVAIEGYDFCYEYALLDDQWNHIMYVYTMNTIEDDIKFSSQELPSYFMEDFEEFTVSGLDRFTMYGGYENEGEAESTPETVQPETDDESAEKALFMEEDITGKGISLGEETGLTSWQGYRELPIVFNLQSDQEKAYLSVRFGGVRVEENMRSHWLAEGEPIENGETVIWKQSGYVGDYQTQVYMGSVYGDVLIREGEQLTGYAVIELTVSGNGELKGEVLREVRFPQVDGAYQQITEEEVRSEIEKLILDRAGRIDTVESLDVRPAVGTGEGADLSVAERLVCEEVTDESWIDTPKEWDMNVEMTNRKLTVYSEDPDVEFYLTTDKGRLISDGDSELSGDGRLEAVKLKSGESVLYTTGIKENNLIANWCGEKTYVNVIMKKEAEGYIVGYAVLELTFPNLDSTVYSEARIIVQEKFPQVDGEYQTVPEEYVWNRIHGHKNGEAGNGEAEPDQSVDFGTEPFNGEQPCIYWCGKLYYWDKTVNRSSIPVNFCENMALSVTEDMPDADGEIKGFELEGILYTDYDTNVVYAWIESPLLTDWEGGKYVRFTTEYIENEGKGLLYVNDSLYSFMVDAEYAQPAEEVPEGYEIIGSLNFIGYDYIPTGHLETNADDGYGHSLARSPLYYSEESPEIVYVPVINENQEIVYRPGYLVITD